MPLHTVGRVLWHRVHEVVIHSFTFVTELPKTTAPGKTDDRYRAAAVATSTGSDGGSYERNSVRRRAAAGSRPSRVIW